MALRVSNESLPDSFDAFGIPRQSVVQQTIIGKTRTLSSIKPHEWIFLGFSLAGLFAALALTIYRLSVGGEDFLEDDFTFAILLLLNIVFCIYYVIHGILKERANELMVFVITVCVVLIYCIGNYFVSTKNKIKLIRLILIAALGPFLIGCSVYIARKYYLSGNLIFRTVGANATFQKMCKYMFLCSSLLKFDLQLQASMLILVLEKGVKITKYEIIWIVVGLIITLIWIFLGFISMRLESKHLLGIFYALSLFEPSFIIYKMYIAISIEDNKEDAVLRTSVITCGVFGLVVWATTIIVMTIVMLNFGKGLKEKVYGTPELDRRKTTNAKTPESPSSTSEQAQGDV